MAISSVGLDEKRIGNSSHGLNLTASALRYEVVWCGMVSMCGVVYHEIFHRDAGKYWI